MYKELFSQYKSKIIVVAIVSALTSILNVLLISIISQAIGVASSNETYELLAYFGGAIALLFLLGFLSQWLLAKLGTSLIFNLRSSLMRRVLNSEHEHIEKVGTHRIYATITNDVNSMADAFAMLPVFIVNLSTVVFCFAYLFTQSVGLTFILIASLAMGVGGISFIMKTGMKKFTELRELEDDMFNRFRSMVDGSKELSLNLTRRNFFLSSLADPSLKKIHDKELDAQYYWILSQSWGGVILFLCLGVLVLCSLLFFPVSTAILTSFVLYMTYIVGPISFIMRAFEPISRGKVAYNKVNSLKLNNVIDGYDGNTSDLASNSEWRSICLSDVTYQYDTGSSESFSVGPISLKINRNEIVLLKGGNGSGKSTFAKILVGLYSAKSGSISMDGMRINKDNLQWYKSHFSTIFSDYHLFEHILDSKGNLVEKKDVWAYVQELGLTDKVDITNGRLSTINLSEGQKKRLALLLAYAEDAEIYLFDEWTADQDPEFRRYFYKDILPRMKRDGKTLIVISHDDRYFSVADRVYSFDYGKIVEEKEINKVSNIT